MRSLGIDIGTYSIKVVEISTTSKNFYINRFIEQPLGQSLNADHDLEILEFLRNLLKEYDPNQTQYCFALKQDDISSRLKVFPFKERQKILKSIAFELEEDIPFQPDNAVYDGKIRRVLGNQAEVLACAARKETVAETLQKLKDIGITPNILSSEGFALSNIFENWHEAPPALPSVVPMDESETKPVKKLWALLNLGHSHTVVNYYEGSLLLHSRAISWGGRQLADTISKKYDLPFNEAIKELQSKGFILTVKKGATPEQAAFSDVIASGLQDLIRDLRLSMVEMKSEHNAEIDACYMCGGVSQLQNLGPFLTQMLEVSVNRMNPLNQINNVLFEKTAHAEVVSLVALGLAFEGLKRPRNPALNFLRGEFAFDSGWSKQLWQSWGSVIKVSAAALFVLFIYASLRESTAMSLADSAHLALKDQAKNLAGLTGSKANVSGVKKYINEQKKRARDAKEVRKLIGMNSALDILKKISDGAPAKNLLNLDVQKLSIKDSDVVIEGVVNNTNEVKLLQSSLSSFAKGSQIKNLAPTIGVPPGRVVFAFGFQVDRTSQGTVQ